MIQGVIQRLLDGHDLTRDEARGTMGEIMGGEATQAQIAGFLVALRAKGETADEIAGCAEAMREHVLQVRPGRTDLVDVVGTGGDGANTYNISTAAAIVDGGGRSGGREARQPVGLVADGLGGRARGARLPARAAAGEDRAVDRRARLRLPLRAGPPSGDEPRGPVRRELATRTVFNVLGPLTNPAGARRSVVGVYSPQLARTLADGARPARREARVRRARRGRDRRALAVRPEPRLRGSSPGRFASTSSTRSSSGSRAARRTSCAAGIPRRTLRRCAMSSPAPPAGTARPCSSTRRAGSRRSAKRTTSEKDSSIAREALDSGAAAARLDELVGSSRMRLSGGSSSSQPRARRDRRVQAPLPVAGRHPSRRPRRGHRPGATARRRRSGDLGARRRALRRHARRPPRGARRHRHSAPREGFLLDRRASAEVREAGADAALLILRDLDDATAAALMDEAERLGLDTLVEAHDAEELDRATRLGAALIGVNARDLGTFAIDRRAQLRLVAQAPRDRVIVAESAIHSRAQAAAARARGCRRRARGNLADARARPWREASRARLAPAREGLRSDAAEGRRRRGRGGRRHARLRLRRQARRARAPAVLDVPDTALSVAVFVGAPQERGADLVQVYEPEDGKARGRRGYLASEHGRVQVWDLPWDEPDPDHWAKARTVMSRGMLAGRLGPDNVRAAIAAVQPWAVDAASRLESAPGIKDHAKVRAFVEAARA